MKTITAVLFALFLGLLAGTTLAIANAQDRQLERAAIQAPQGPILFRAIDSTHRITCYYSPETRLHACAGWGH